ncbi:MULTISPECIES: AI-2E family transporter [unclassified Leucobacter]|uniref:AI-2E family transporter n=1 Tax=unclassified Leucobacter TaxID=2621730 RepID=UPI00165D65BA|nr:MULTISPECIES: AI-2E family transporter [unclassified Leucobacter]MBC9927567.1 AI-2E family transporter [Leucobacter sp. cx-169]
MFGRRSDRRRAEQAFAAGAAAARPAPRDANPAVDRTPEPPVHRGLWSQGFGFIATRSIQIIAVVALLIAVIWGLQSLTIVVIPILLALIIASAFAPVMRWMRAHRVPDALATVLVLVAVLLILTGVGWLIVSAVRDQWDDLSAQAQDGFEQVLEWGRHLPFAPSADQFADWQKTVIDFLTSSQFGSGALAGVGAVSNFVTGLVLMIVVLFFFLKDGPRIWSFMLRPFHDDHLERARRVGEKTVQTFGSYIRGTAAVALVDSIGIGIGITILQVPLALPLSVLVFLLSFIPLVGATVAGILAALVALVANGPVNALLVIGVVVLVNQLEGNFLQPVLMGRALKLHALVILLALTVGTVLGGILGAVLAVPIAAVAWGVVKVWDGPDLAARWARPRKELEQV